MSNINYAIIALVVVVLLALGYELLSIDNNRDVEGQKTFGQRISDVFDPPKVDDTPREKLGQDVKTLGDKIKNDKSNNDDTN